MESLPNVYETLGSIPCTTKKKKIEGICILDGCLKLLFSEEYHSSL